MGSSGPTVLQTMLASIRNSFSGDYGVWMKPAKLQTFCELEWLTFNVGWPTEGMLDLATIVHVRDIVLGSQVIQTSFLTLTPGTSWPPAYLTGYIFIHPRDTYCSG
jgi:hypothetical protein